MQICEKIANIRKLVSDWKNDGQKVGFVPTMGYLHEGHASLVKKSVEDNDKTVVSIFVNPLQFGPMEDLEAYPRDFEKDHKFLESLKADVLFYPTSEEMYKQNSLTTVYVSEMSQKLCGITRPIHFKGVTTVVSKLFNIVTPNNAYFGLKDFQQYSIITKMVEDLNFPVNIIGVPIVRDENGLALSSRNIYLKDDEKLSALSLNKSLKLSKQMVDNNELNSNIVIKAMADLISSQPHTKIDYIKIVNKHTLENIETIIPGHSAVLLAVYVGKARLIDNITL